MAHRSQLAIGLVALLLLSFSPTGAQQAADRSAVSSIEGVVVKLGTGEPLSEAEVELSKVDEGTTYTATTHDDGKFAFENVLPGDYRLVVTRAGGYMPAEYGQRSPNGRGIPITLAAGWRTTDVRLAMAPTGSISGRIFDEDGEPAGSVQMQALRATYWGPTGQRLLTVVQSVQTNDRGEYRLFWLPPGRYYVNAGRRSYRLFVNPPDRAAVDSLSFSPPFITQRTLESGEVREEADLPMYFPGSTDLANASPIDLITNTDIGGLDMVMVPPIAARHIRGVVIDGVTGQPVARASVRSTPRNLSHEMSVSVGLTDEQGAFDIPGVVPGAYFIVATVGEDGDGMGYTPVDVGNSDLEKIAVVAKAGFDIAGKVVFEGTPAGDNGRPPSVIPEIQRDPYIPGWPPPQPFGVPAPNLQPDGSFIFKGVGPGNYRVSVREMGDSLSQRIYFKSMRLGVVDVLNDGLHIDGKPESPLEIVIGADVGTLDGSVVNEKMEPVANATVAIVPDATPLHRPDLYKNLSTDLSGRFHTQGIAPGDYIVLAWEDVEYGAWQDPEFVRMYESRGTRIHIGEGRSETIQVTVSQ